MKLAILIQVHKNPEQLRKLCEVLDNKDISLFINVDKKVDIESFLALKAEYITRRVKVSWGDFSQVRASLEGLKQIAKGDYEKVLFISGQDWPLVSPEHILDRLPLAVCAGKLSPDSTMHNRYAYRHVNGSFSLIINKLIKIFSKPKSFYFTGDVYKGSSWWSMSMPCVRYVLDFCAEHPDYLQFFEGSHCCDELFYQNIVARSPFADSHLKPESEHFTFTLWPKNSPNPKVLDKEDLILAKKSNKLFARKVEL